MNEPVAWMSNEYSVCSKEAYKTLSENARSWYPIPLYTHPVELTDDEKTELENALKVCEYKYFGSYPLSEEQWEAFELLEKHAKAILKKAQEK